MKAKKIASLACAFLLACSAFPVNVCAAEEENWGGYLVDCYEIDDTTLESKEDIIIDGVTYSFKEAIYSNYKYVYESVIDGVTYVAVVEYSCTSAYCTNHEAVVACNIPKDIVIDGISYSFYNTCTLGVHEGDSYIQYEGIVDGIPRIIYIKLGTGEVAPAVTVYPETFVEESTGRTYSLVEGSSYEAVVGEITYGRGICCACQFNKEIVDITVNGVTYPVFVGFQTAKVDGIYYRPMKIIYSDDIATYSYYPYAINENGGSEKLGEIDPESILSEIDGFPVFTDEELEIAYARAFCKECEELENSGIATQEDEIESPTVKGDATGDGEVDISDVVFANKATLGKTELSQAQAEALDINENGIVDATDSLAILKYVVGLLETL